MQKGAKLVKPEIEFAPTGSVDWTGVHDQCPGLVERVLARDPETGVATRMLRFPPGADTTPMGPQRHDFWEEVYIIEGTLHDLNLDATFHAGDFACRPPGMPHGPWSTADGCLTFEVRYTTELLAGHDDRTHDEDAS